MWYKDSIKDDITFQWEAEAVQAEMLAFTGTTSGQSIYGLPSSMIDPLAYSKLGKMDTKACSTSHRSRDELR